ncbi:MAG: hypothetical protein R3C26_06535 [Calditrichia bacterium]
MRNILVAGKTGGIAGRLAKYALIDLPADYFSVSTGARIFRTRCAISRARYEQHLLCVRHALPYGNGGGEASNYESVEISQQELLSIWQGRR